MSVTTADIEKLQARIDELQTGTDTSWLMLTGCNCFLMVLGFALLEAGSLRAQNLSMVMLKQAVVACVTGLVWYLWGHGLAFGDGGDNPNNFLGTGGSLFALSKIDHWSNVEKANWFFQMTFCTVSCSIISGAIGERMSFPVYFGYLWLAAGWIYPITAYSEWSSNGWNSPFNNKQKTASLGAHAYTGAIDAAGCGPVHIVGGIAAFIGAWRVRPRHGRFDPKTGEATHMPGHNSSLVTMGVLILWFSWFSFNTGARIVHENHHHLVVARSIVNLMISSCACGLFTLLTCTLKAYIFEGHKSYFPLNKMLGGILTGLVASTAGSTVVEPWAAFIYGVLGVPTYLLLSHLELDILKIDDPVEAFPVHFGGGVLGLFLTGLFAQIDAIRIAFDDSIPKDGAGAFMGGDGKLLGYNLISIVFCTCWSAFFTLIYFLATEYFLGTLRVSSENEEKGMAKVFGEGYDYLTPLEKIKQMESHLKVLYCIMNDGLVNQNGMNGDCGGDGGGAHQQLSDTASMDSRSHNQNQNSSNHHVKETIQDRINQGRGAGSQIQQHQIHSVYHHLVQQQMLLSSSSTNQNNNNDDDEHMVMENNNNNNCSVSRDPSLKSIVTEDNDNRNEAEGEDDEELKFVQYAKTNNSNNNNNEPSQE